MLLVIGLSPSLVAHSSAAAARWRWHYSCELIESDGDSDVPSLEEQKDQLGGFEGLCRWFEFREKRSAQFIVLRPGAEMTSIFLLGSESAGDEERVKPRRETRANQLQQRTADMRRSTSGQDERGSVRSAREISARRRFSGCSPMRTCVAPGVVLDSNSVPLCPSHCGTNISKLKTVFHYNLGNFNVQHVVNILSVALSVEDPPQLRLVFSSERVRHFSVETLLEVIQIAQRVPRRQRRRRSKVHSPIEHCVVDGGELRFLNGIDLRGCTSRDCVGSEHGVRT